jgi:hypothetical protein
VHHHEVEPEIDHCRRFFEQEEPGAHGLDFRAGLRDGPIQTVRRGRSRGHAPKLEKHLSGDYRPLVADE